MSSSEPYAVVLAGGEGRRFGGDKLAAGIDGRTLLDHALDGLPVGTRIIVVGPERPTSHEDVTFVSEDPPGGGPAAGLIAGLTWALSCDPATTSHSTDSEARVIVTLPGDAPAGGRAARFLLTELGPEDPSVVGVDPAGLTQVLQLALRPAAARRLVELAGPDRGRDQSVRRLVAALAPRSVVLSEELSRDIDTTDQLRHFRNPDCT